MNFVKISRFISVECYDYLIDKTDWNVENGLQDVTDKEIKFDIDKIAFDFCSQKTIPGMNDFSFNTTEK